MWVFWALVLLLHPVWCQVVDRSGENLSAVPSDLPKNSTELILENNLISTLDSCQFCGFTALQYLHLRNNSITYVSPTAFKNTSLIELYLSENELTSVPDLNEIAAQLEVLVLNDNKISTLPDGILNMSRLRSLELCRNKLHDANTGEFCFSDLSSLQILKLSFNNFTGEIVKRVSKSPLASSLDQLILQGNEVGYTPLNETEQALRQMRSLTKLDIRGNKMKAIPDIYHGNPEFTLRAIQAIYNQIVCDSSALWLKEVQEDLDVRVTLSACKSPSALVDRSWNSLVREELDPLRK